MIDVATSGFWMHELIAEAMADQARTHALWTPESLVEQAELARNVRGLFTYTGAMPIDRSVLDALPALEVIVVMGAGIDAVDADAAAERNIAVLNCPGANTEDVAEYAMGLMIAAARGIVHADAAMRQGEWKNVTNRRLSGRKLGLLGMGAIGQAVAVRASSFRMPVSYTSRRPVDSLPYRHVPDLAGLAADVDVLVLAAPATPETHHIVNADVLNALGPEGILVNVARGALVDEAALAAALSSGRLGAAALDVFAQEPGSPEALRRLSNVVLSPHNGANTHDAFAAVRAAAVRQMRERLSS